MGKPSIIQKLRGHLAHHMPPSEECHVLYLMAEIRKILEQEDSKSQYAPLNFYANWCVHTRLARPNKFINRTAEDIESEILASIKADLPIENGKLVKKFLSMQALKTALSDFLNDVDLPAEITEGGNWASFQALLISIISEQPIIAPSKRIAQFLYDDSGNGSIEFEIEPPKLSHYKFSE
jgi:hypothetical protein